MKDAVNSLHIRLDYCLRVLNYLRTLVEDMERFRPDPVEQISLIDAGGRIIATSTQDSKQIATLSWFHKENNDTTDSG